MSELLRSLWILYWCILAFIFIIYALGGDITYSILLSAINVIVAININIVQSKEMK